MQISITQVDQSTTLKLDEWELIETDLNEEALKREENSGISLIGQYKFVIGISKPLEIRIGRNSIQKSKITIKGLLGIQAMFIRSQ
ncbi:unnamed protein product (macronuclear) [Paramecium tetraurelia]|uniref:Uncharacterized protein n=1 Tax=Paramecium tetraurelia TaxID=5888 RepID=A0EE98_PARTE|nr:uncharacterized protein GSPATT00025960001 [Paramecium tetraurelia]CAK93615.1 unnamed protein product [Paramecium tetraurelia]|eukprot:XP_001461012.1 hypothetical protein (macronuclear) [Paramecium tetraurelia strain d4-2]